MQIVSISENGIRAKEIEAIIKDNIKIKCAQMEKTHEYIHAENVH